MLGSTYYNVLNTIMSTMFRVYDTILQEEFSEHEVVSMLRDAGNE